MLKVLNDLLHSLDRGNVSVVTLLDLSAAFDHTILLQRLRRVFDIHSILLYTAFLLTSQTELKLKLSTTVALP